MIKMDLFKDELKFRKFIKHYLQKKQLLTTHLWMETVFIRWKSLVQTIDQPQAFFCKKNYHKHEKWVLFVLTLGSSTKVFKDKPVLVGLKRKYKDA